MPEIDYLTKGQRDKRFQLVPPLGELLRCHIGDGGGLIFTRRTAVICGLNYDQIEHEFHSIAGRLQWPQAATLKDFRHLFSTCLENSGVPEFYRRYFMGQSPGKTPIVTYTHLNELQTQFSKALQCSLAPLLSAIAERVSQLKLANNSNADELAEA